MHSFRGCLRGHTSIQLQQPCLWLGQKPPFLPGSFLSVNAEGRSVLNLWVATTGKGISDALRSPNYKFIFVATS